MRAPRTLIGRITGAPLLRDPVKRRVLFAVLLALCAVLSLFPQKYRAAVSLTPTDPTSLGLSGTLNQLGAIGSVFGNQSQLEVSLKVARSEYVRTIVVRQLHLDRRLDRSMIRTHRWLDREVDIRSLRGGIIQFETKQRDPEFARQIVAAYGEAVRNQLALISRNQTAQKRQILVDLITSSSEQLAKAQEAYDSFRLQTRNSSPQTAIFAAGDRVRELETLIRAREVELSAARQFATDSEPRIRQMIATIAALRQQLEEVRSTSPDQQSSVGELVRQSTEVDKLRRNLLVAQTLYDNYKRFLQGTTVEDLTSSANIRILEPAYVDTERQINLAPASIGIILLLIALAIEAYEMRLPVGERAAS